MRVIILAPCFCVCLKFSLIKRFLFNLEGEKMKKWKNVIIVGRHMGVHYMTLLWYIFENFHNENFFFFKKILSHPPCCTRMELLSTAPGPCKSASHSCTMPCWSQHPCPLYRTLQDLGLPSATRHCHLCHTSCVVLCPLGMACLPTLAAKRATSHLGSAQETPPSGSWATSPASTLAELTTAVLQSPQSMWPGTLQRVGFVLVPSEPSTKPEPQ